MNTRERGLRNAGLWTAALAGVGVATTFGVVAVVHSAGATTTTSTTTQSTSNSGVYSGNGVSSGHGQAQAQSGGS
jgi:hypothetical protein